jgi:hypothetical protein
MTKRVKKSAYKQAFWCHIINSFLIHCLMSVFQNMCQNSDVQIAITFDSLDRFWWNKHQNVSNGELYHRELFFLGGGPVNLKFGLLSLTVGHLLIVQIMVLNFGNALTLVVINMIYFANIFPLSVKDNHTGSVAHIYINIYIFIFFHFRLYTFANTNGIPQI